MQPVGDTAYLLEHVSSTLHRQSDQVLQERLGIGISQFKILIMLHGRPGVTQREIADYLGQTEASISRQVKILHQKGLLASHVDPAEHRRHLAVLTAKGAKFTQAAHDVLESFNEPMLSQLSSREQEQLQRLLTTLHEYTCSPGKRMACDRPRDIETIYTSQKAAKTA